MENILLTQSFSLWEATSLAATAAVYLLAGLLAVLLARPLARGLLRLARLAPSYTGASPASASAPLKG
jgi:hypothetical protein